MREQPPVHFDMGGFVHHQQSKDATQVSRLTFDYNQASFAQGLQMLDSDLVSIGNPQEVTLGLEQERPATRGFACHRSFSLANSQESDAGVGKNSFL